MVEKESSAPVVEVIDEQTTFTLAELCRCCAVEAELIEAMVEHGILGVNLAGAALALDLLERIDELDARLRALSR